MEVPVFRPTFEETQSSWEGYMQNIEPAYDQVGICKIIPPKGWQPSKQPPEKKDVLIRGPVTQALTGSQGLYQAIMQKRSPMWLHSKYKPYATDSVNGRQPSGSCPEDIEREFWRSTTRTPPIYGADTEATLFDADCKGWNLSNLDSLLTRGLTKRIPGVNTSYLYFGVWRSFFGWHTEDMDLHSVNYLHYGAPKQWYCIPPPHRARFEAYVKNSLSDCFRACPSFFRHKELLISPKKLAAANIPFVKVVQYPGEMIVNCPGAYHAGFNTGFNCAEATNFATPAWLELGAKADVCECRKDCVSIDMREFLRFATPEVQDIINANFFSESESDGSDEASDTELQSDPDSDSGDPHSGSDLEDGFGLSDCEDDLNDTNFEPSFVTRGQSLYRSPKRIASLHKSPNLAQHPSASQQSGASKQSNTLRATKVSSHVMRTESSLTRPNRSSDSMHVSKGAVSSKQLPGKSVDSHCRVRVKRPVEPVLSSALQSGEADTGTDTVRCAKRQKSHPKNTPSGEPKSLKVIRKQGLSGAKVEGTSAAELARKQADAAARDQRKKARESRMAGPAADIVARDRRKQAREARAMANSLPYQERAPARKKTGNTPVKGSQGSELANTQLAQANMRGASDSAEQPLRPNPSTADKGSPELPGFRARRADTSPGMLRLGPFLQNAVAKEAGQPETDQNAGREAHKPSKSDQAGTIALGSTNAPALTFTGIKRKVSSLNQQLMAMASFQSVFGRRSSEPPTIPADSQADLDPQRVPNDVTELKESLCGNISRLGTAEAFASNASQGEELVEVSSPDSQGQRLSPESGSDTLGISQDARPVQNQLATEGATLEMRATPQNSLLESNAAENFASPAQNLVKKPGTGLKGAARKCRLNLNDAATLRGAAAKTSQAKDTQAQSPPSAAVKRRASQQASAVIQSMPAPYEAAKKRAR